ncbi:cytochrome P450 [Nocardia bovistercoris]|uniref:Cytochrome P450 n=1 Tax=Nocardia bovistercoris TaxID=2785916 RepID=A0A931IDX2_9NOCA|nr:cytochrome P450 [Nocardia bovistercoris]MBH0779624.1 cytochrome P450 [Nocardia bovistercoris]
MTVDSQVRRYPFGEPFRLEIDPHFAELRKDEPVARVQLPYGGEGWLVTRYDDVKSVLSDRRFSRADTVAREDIPRSTPEPSRPDGLLTMDPPEHTRLRKLVAKAFTGRRVEQLRPRIAEIVEQCLTAMRRRGAPADLVQDLALPLPVAVICEMLGIPARDQHRFREFSDATLSTTAYTREEIAAARGGLEAYLAEVVAERRTRPTDDLLAALTAARDEDDRLSEQELVNLGIVLLIAGHETTANQIANFVYTLLGNPGEWERLRANPDLLPGAIEELLRYIQLGAGTSFARMATEDVELSGVRIRAGDAVLVHMPSANRDESVFPDAEKLVLERKVNPHVAFGHGVHHCLGAQLARLELRIALGGILDHFPTLRLAVPVEEIPWKTGLLVRGPRELPVAW